MALALFRKEVAGDLRKPALLWASGAFYSVLVLFVSLGWGGVAFAVDRTAMGRGLYYGILWCAFFLAPFAAAAMASKGFADEERNGTADLLRVTPLFSFSVVFQKLAAAAAEVWLIFFGTLPIVSLILIIGGLAPGEFLYQLVNLAVFLNTSILVGLGITALSGRKKRAERNALFVVAILIFSPYIAFQLILFPLSSLSARPGWEWITVIHRMLLPPSNLLCLFSPAWMVPSWPGGDIPGFPDAAKTLPWGNAFPPCPALLSWMSHFALQAVLFVAAALGWRMTDSRGQAPDSWKTATNPVQWLRWMLRGRSIRGLFPSGWWTFYEQERREVFPRSNLTEPIYVGAMTLMGLVGWAFAGDQALWAVLVVSGLILIPFCMIYPSSAFLREKKTGTAVFLVVSSEDARKFLLEKWIFYMLLGVNILAPGMLVAMVAILLQPNGDGLSTLIFYAFMMAAIPFISILGIAFGVYPRHALSTVFILIMLVVLPFISWGFIILAQMSLIMLLRDPGAVLNEPPFSVTLRRIVRRALTAALVILSFLAFTKTFMPMDILLFAIVNLVFGMSGMALCLWLLLLRDSDTWWRDRLLPWGKPRWVRPGPKLDESG